MTKLSEDGSVSVARFDRSSEEVCAGVPPI